jgi:2-(1,2-epoxy-1,2-dihydrophenyl)acetyl-CoA isomerase
MSTDDILRSDRGAIVVLTLNRPDVLNSFTRPMAKFFQDHLGACASDPAVRAVVLTGSGKGFCAGQDLNEFLTPESRSAGLGETVGRSYNPIISAIRSMEKPVICALNGVAAGAGANIALACDFVVAGEGASIVQSFTKIGLVPDSGGTFLLPRIVGLAKATELIMLAGKLSAPEAFACGLIYRVVPDAEVSTEALLLAKRLAAMPTKALGLAKRLLNSSWRNGLEEQLEMERVLQDEAGRTEDFQEGVAAFLEKRPPAYRGT